MFPLSWPRQNSPAANRLKVAMVLLLLDCLNVTRPAYSRPQSRILCSKTKKQTIKHRCERLQLWHVQWKLLSLILVVLKWASVWVAMSLRRDFKAVWLKKPKSAAHIVLIDVVIQNRSNSHAGTTALRPRHNAVRYQINGTHTHHSNRCHFLFNCYYHLFIYLIIIIFYLFLFFFLFFF